MSNTPKIIEEVEVSEEEMKELETAWYGYQATLELVRAGLNDPFTMADYKKEYASYNRVWSKITKKYLSKDYGSMGAAYNQSADFGTRKITITKN